MENNQRNSRKRLNSLILLVAFTAVMLIISTYAWFSAQKNVTIGGLEGIVKVAEGLEISLDAQSWSQEINFAKYTSEQLKRQYGVKADGTITGHTFTNDDFDDDVDVEHNIIPEELLPVSTTGTSTNGIGLADMNMYRGIVKTESNKSSLSDVITVLKRTSGYTTQPLTEGATDEDLTVSHHDYPGYYAIDLFLKNSTRTTEAGTTNYSEILQLNTNSQLQLKAGGSTSTGLQNTVRVAFAIYNATGSVATDTLGGTNNTGGDGVTDEDWTAYINNAGTTVTNYMSANTTQILNAFKGQVIKDVAIWEPNASDHVDYIYKNVEQYKNTTNGGKYPKFSLDDSKLFMNSGLAAGVTGMTYLIGDPAEEKNVEAMRTYALTSAAVTAGSVADIYDWATASDSLDPQVTLQTEKTSTTDFKIAGGVKNLVSVTAPATAKYTAGNEEGAGPQTVAAASGEEAQKPANFQTENKNLRMQDGAVAKVRMYVWLEGQDVDTINHASHGAGIKLDVGLLKDGTVGQS